MSDELKDKEKQESSNQYEENVAEKEYDAAWDEAGKELEGSEEHGEIDGGSGEGLPEKAPQEKELKTEEPAEDPHEKALRDTKVWATKLAMENAELRKMIEAFKAGKASADDVKDAHQAVAKTQADLNSVKERVYEDYPELKDLLDPIIERSYLLEKEVSELKVLRARAEEQNAYKEALDYFNAVVKPEILKVHPDFDDILFKNENGKKTVNDEYFQWAEKQSPAMRFAAMESSDPQDIIMAVSAYKKFKASGEAKEIKLRQEQDKKQKLINAMSLRGGGMPIPAGYRRGSPDDYDSAWNEADSILKKQGIG